MFVVAERFIMFSLVPVTWPNMKSPVVITSEARVNRGILRKCDFALETAWSNVDILFVGTAVKNPGSLSLSEKKWSDRISSVVFSKVL